MSIVTRHRHSRVGGNLVLWWLFTVTGEVPAYAGTTASTDYCAPRHSTTVIPA